MFDPNVPVPEDAPVPDGSTVLPDLNQRSRRAVVTYLVAVVVLGTPLVWWFGRLNPEVGRSLLVLFMWVASPWRSGGPGDHGCEDHLWHSFCAHPHRRPDSGIVGGGGVLPGH